MAVKFAGDGGTTKKNPLSSVGAGVKKMSATPTLPVQPGSGVKSNPNTAGRSVYIPPSKPAVKPRTTPAPSKAPTTRTTTPPAPSPAPSSSSFSAGPAISQEGMGGIGNPLAGISVTPAPAPIPVPLTEKITIPDPLADAGYKAQAAELAQQMVDFKATQGLQAGQYDTSYNDGMRKLGVRNGRLDAGVLDPGSYGGARNAATNDFAGRNAIFSSGYADSLRDVDNSFNDRMLGLNTARKDFQDNQQNALSAFTNQNTQGRQNAEREAIARIASQYGVNLDQVVAGRQNMIERAL